MMMLMEVPDLNTVLKKTVHCFVRAEFGCSVFHGIMPITDMFNYPDPGSNGLLKPRKLLQIEEIKLGYASSHLSFAYSLHE